MDVQELLERRRWQAECLRLAVRLKRMREEVMSARNAPVTETKNRKPPQGGSGTPAAPLAAELSPLELHAVAQAGKQAKALRDRLTVGAGQVVDVTVRICGALSVGESGPSGTADEVASAQTVLAFLLAHMRPSTRATLLQEIKGRYTDWLHGAKEEPVPGAIVQGYAQDFLRHLTRRVEATGKRGNVTGAVAIELVRRPPVRQSA